jgi:hypothetical protein
MGEAKRKLKRKEEYWLESKKFTSRFNSVKEFPAFTYSGNKNLHSIKSYHHLMRLIFIRAKHLNKAIVEAIESNNSYTSFILLKAYWENVAMFAYMYIGAENYIKQKEYSPLLEWVIKHALGGKKWPSNEILQKKGMKREDFQQTNLLTWMQKMDKDFDRNVGSGKKMSEFGKVYDEFIAESGHSSFLGLSICEQKQDDGSIIPALDKTYQINDDAMTLNYLSISNLYFFYYWNKFCEHQEEH